METSSIQLFAIPFTCSLASHLAFEEAGLPFHIHWMKRGPGKTTPDGGPFEDISPSGKVPVLVQDGGTSTAAVLRENVCVLTAIADIANPDRSMRYDELEWLTFIGTEIHKQVLAAWFDPDAPQTTKDDVKERLLPPALAVVEAQCAANDYVLGSTVSPPDFYLFWSLLLIKEMGVRLDSYPSLREFRGRMRQRPAVAKVLAAEMAQFQAQLAA